MATCGFDGISVEEAVDIPQAQKEIIEDNCVILGNISTSKTLLSGNSDEVKGDVKKAIDDGIDILAPSCGIAPNTPLDNIKAAISERNEYFNL
jgi:[methyl-Co(III) methanol-specific corrinoid protein]:coenzyme M methyltransferase